MAEKKIKFKIVTPERTVFEDEIDQATLPVTDGQVTILPNHRSYIATLKSGEVRLKKATEEIVMATSGGFLELDHNQLTILADTAEHAEEIDLARAEEAKKRAEEMKNQQPIMAEEEYARVMAAIDKESSRIRVAKKHRTKNNLHIEN